MWTPEGQVTRLQYITLAIGREVSFFPSPHEAHISAENNICRLLWKPRIILFWFDEIASHVFLHIKQWTSSLVVSPDVFNNTLRITKSKCYGVPLDSLWAELQFTGTSGRNNNHNENNNNNNKRKRSENLVIITQPETDKTERKIWLCVCHTSGGKKGLNPS